MLSFAPDLVPLVRVAVVTKRALVLQFTIVRSFVRLEVAFLREGAITSCALKWPLTRVRTHVAFATSPLAESPATHTAFIGLFP